MRGPRDLLAGALTPVVRKSWTSLPDGHVAIAIGDAWITNDPLMGQGANIASHCAWALAAAIAKGGPFDEGFAARVEAETWSYAMDLVASSPRKRSSGREIAIFMQVEI